MESTGISRPDPSEYAVYYGTYISLVEGNDVLTAMTRQGSISIPFLRSIPEARGDFRYAPDKWSVKEVLTHVIDTERVFSYRALSFARGDAGPLPGFEQDDWIRTAAAAAVPLSELVDEFEFVRRSTILFFKHLAHDALLRRGVASGNPFTPRALAYIIAGHELHHWNVLKKNYL